MRNLILGLLFISGSAHAQVLTPVWADLFEQNNQSQSEMVSVPDIDWSIPAELTPIHNVISGESIEDIQNSRMLEGGSSFGIGGDTRDKRHATAWFYGTDPIKTCYSLSVNFGASEKLVRESIKKSIQQWQSYFTKKRINEKLQVRVNTNFDLQGPCVGGEDLRLYFGTGPIWQNLSDLKAVQSLERPVAYYNKTHLSSDLRWSRGYIRFVSHGYYESGYAPFPDWKKPLALESFINHELGHILGFQHSDGTVMSGDIVTEGLLRKDKQIFPKTDQALELITCLECPNSYSRLDRATNEDFGLSQEAMLQLGSRGDLVLFDDGRKWKLEVHGMGSVHFEEVLHTNFDLLRRLTSQVIYASLEVESEVIPVTLEFTSLKKIRITAFKDGVYKKMGVFHAR